MNPPDQQAQPALDLHGRRFRVEAGGLGVPGVEVGQMWRRLSDEALFEIRDLKQSQWEGGPYAVRIRRANGRSGHWLYARTLIERYRLVPLPEPPGPPVATAMAARATQKDPTDA